MEEILQALDSQETTGFVDRPLLLTPKAIEKVHAFAAGNVEAAGKFLRIYVEGGGCSGFNYGFKFDSLNEEDLVVEQGGIKVLLDPMSLPYLRGSTVDFKDEFGSSGFMVQNPNAKSSCGCGTSFSA